MAEAQELLRAALAAEAEGYRLLIADAEAEARPHLREASDLYRRSWETAPPDAYGRLIGMLKTAVLAGGGEPEGAYALAELGTEGSSAPGWYAIGLAGLATGDDDLARRAAAEMRAAGPGDGADPFTRTAAAVGALAERDREAYAAAVGAIVADFESRDEHLTGVPIADTALVLERLAARRGLAAAPPSPLLPGA